MKQKINSITDLRNDLLAVYKGLRTDTLDIQTAKELSNTAGKVISSVKIQMEYASMRGEEPDIEFMSN
jgi:hypothetical protein